MATAQSRLVALRVVSHRPEFLPPIVRVLVGRDEGCCVLRADCQRSSFSLPRARKRAPALPLTPAAVSRVKLLTFREHLDKLPDALLACLRLPGGLEAVRDGKSIPLVESIEEGPSLRRRVKGSQEIIGDL